MSTLKRIANWWNHTPEPPVPEHFVRPPVLLEHVKPAPSSVPAETEENVRDNVTQLANSIFRLNRVGAAAKSELARRALMARRNGA